MQRGNAIVARSRASVPPGKPAPIGGNGAYPPASAQLSLGFSLIRLSVPARLVFGGAAVLLSGLCIAWVLA